MEGDFFASNLMTVKQEPPCEIVPCGVKQQPSCEIVPCGEQTQPGVPIKLKDCCVKLERIEVDEFTGNIAEGRDSPRIDDDYETDDSVPSSGSDSESGLSDTTSESHESTRTTKKKYPCLICKKSVH